MGNVVFITRDFDLPYTGGNKIRKDMIKACQLMGIRTICLPGKGFRYFLSLAKLHLREVDFLLLLYPNVPTLRHGGLGGFVKNFIEVLSLLTKKIQFRSRLILFVQDLPIEQIEAMRGEKPLSLNRYLERILLTIADVCGVIGPEMEEMIAQRYAGVKLKCIHYMFPPYFGPVIKKDSELVKPIRVAFVGDLIECRLKGVVNAIREDPWIQYDFYGPHGEWLQGLERRDIQYAGAYPPEDIGSVINKKNHVGLILYDPYNEKVTSYMSMATTVKFMTYVFSGLPVITYSRYKHLAEIVTEYNIGWIFDEPDQIPRIFSELDSTSYHRTTESVTKFAKEIASGEYFSQYIKTALKKALERDGNE